MRKMKKVLALVLALCLCFGGTKGNPRLCRGNKRALAENKEIKRIPQ